MDEADFGSDGPASEGIGKRAVAVFLSGKDLIVNARSVAKYLSSSGRLGEDDSDEAPAAIQELLAERDSDTKVTSRRHLSPSGIALSWFPLLDHSQAFEHKQTREHILDAIREFSAQESHSH